MEKKCPLGFVLQVVFNARVPSHEAEGLCARFGQVYPFKQSSNSFLVYLKKRMSPEKIDKIIDKLRHKEWKRVRDVIVMMPVRRNK